MTATPRTAAPTAPDLFVDVDIRPEPALLPGGRGAGPLTPQRTALASSSGGGRRRSGGTPSWERLAVFLDLENLIHPWLGTPAVQLRRMFNLILDQIESLAPVTMTMAAGDRRLVPLLVPVAAERGVRLFPVAPGPDAADRVLLRHLDRIPRSVDGVIIGSGDHGFAGAMARVGGAGCDSIVLSQRRKLSQALLDAVGWYVPLGMASRRPPAPVRTRPAG